MTCLRGLIYTLTNVIQDEPKMGYVAVFTLCVLNYLYYFIVQKVYSLNNTFNYSYSVGFNS